LAVFGPRGRAKRSFYFLVLAVVILVADLKIFVRVLCSSVEKDFPAAGNLVAKVNIANLKYHGECFQCLDAFNRHIQQDFVQSESFQQTTLESKPF